LSIAQVRENLSELTPSAVKHAFQAARTCGHRNAFRMARNIEYAPLGSSSILFFIAIGTTTVVLVDGLRRSVPAFSIFLGLTSLKYLSTGLENTKGAPGNA
jgi:hypothetical protein